MVVLPPNPPPISDGITRIREFSIPRSFAQYARTMNWPWLEHQMVECPSSPTLATAACGSM